MRAPSSVSSKVKRPSIETIAVRKRSRSSLVQANSAQAPAGTFAGYVCGDDDVEKKPSPAPYLAAGRKLGIAPEDMKYCIAVEDSMSGLRSAAASGATTLGQTGFMRIDNSNGPQFASINGYDGITAATLDAYIRRRNA